MRSLTLIFVTLLFFTGCSAYRFSMSPLKGGFSTVSIPYVEGDRDGNFTKILTHKMALSGNLNPVSCGGDLCLKVCLFEPSDENIGFRFVEPSSKIITAHEGRLTLTAKLRVFDMTTNALIFGPIDIHSSIPYDFESDFTRVNEHEFSLGQLEMHTLAKEDAFIPLYSLLAEKIVDTLTLRLMN